VAHDRGLKSERRIVVGVDDGPGPCGGPRCLAPARGVPVADLIAATGMSRPGQAGLSSYRAAIWAAYCSMTT
jgi:hypothetical protein